ncbi:serine dehydratase [Prevotella sp. HMSC069G02]|nr:serine dehydratase [Prevotella sp. HMSC069G02]
MRYGENHIEMEVNGKETDSDKKVKNLIACHTIR